MEWQLYHGGNQGVSEGTLQPFCTLNSKRFSQRSELSINIMPKSKTKLKLKLNNSGQKWNDNFTEEEIKVLLVVMVPCNPFAHCHWTWKSFLQGSKVSSKIMAKSKTKFGIKNKIKIKIQRFWTKKEWDRRGDWGVSEGSCGTERDNSGPNKRHTDPFYENDRLEQHRRCCERNFWNSSYGGGDKHEADQFEIESKKKLSW